MKIVLDSNILFAAIIKDAKIRKIILTSGMEFLFPDFILKEFTYHKHLLIKKSKLTENELLILLSLLIEKTTIVTDQQLKPYLEEAYEISKDIDPQDTIFFACTLAFPDSILWSDDKPLKKQKKIKVLNTQEILKILENTPKK